MSAVLSDMPAGFADACGASQQSFRVLLDAMSRPGRVLSLPPAALLGLHGIAAQAAEPPMHLGTAALLLTLLDADTDVRLGGVLDSAAARAWLRFQAGVGAPRPGDAAAFTVIRAADVTPALWPSLECGSDAAPQRGASLLVEVPALAREPGHRPLTRLRLRGPGIASVQDLAVGGLARGFWQQRIAQEAAFPCGVDLILVCGASIAALPRSTRITLEEAACTSL